MKTLPTTYRGFTVTEKGRMQDMLEDYLQLLDAFSTEIRLFRWAKDIVKDVIRVKDTEEGLHLIEEGLPSLMNKVAPSGTVFELCDDKWMFRELKYEFQFWLTAAQWDLLKPALKNGEIPYACSPVRLEQYRAVKTAIEAAWEDAHGAEHQEG